MLVASPRFEPAASADTDELRRPRPWFEQRSACSIRVSTQGFVRIERIVKLDLGFVAIAPEGTVQALGIGEDHDKVIDAY